MRNVCNLQFKNIIDKKFAAQAQKVGAKDH